jgi:hypothetical protein
MTTRLNVPVIEGKEQIPTGYDLANNDPSKFYIPPCGIEDVDGAVHALFDKDISFRTYQGVSNYEKEVNIKKPFVILATGERFALAKRLKPFRDVRTGALLLPAISIRRTGIEQQNGDVFPGELTVKRRLDESDKDYQSLLNRLLLPNVPVPPDTLRESKGEDQNLPSIKEGMLLDNKAKELRADHIYEIIAIPFPQFYTATYEISLWSNYTQHMNYMLETILANQIAPGKGFYLKTEKGYWFAATVDSGLNAQDNYDDITDAERLTKYSFNMTVRGYILAPSGPGQRVPFKRYLSNINISFETYVAQGNVYNENDIKQYEGTKIDPTLTNPFVLTDIEENPLTAQKPTEQEKILFEKTYKDPTTQTTQTKYVKQMAYNQKQGETVYTASDQQALYDFFIDNKG